MSCRKMVSIETRTAAHLQTLLASDREFSGWLKESREASRVLVGKVDFRPVVGENSRMIGLEAAIGTVFTLVHVCGYYKTGSLM